MERLVKYITRTDPLDGNVITNMDARGKAWVFEYDNRDRRISSKDPLGNLTQWTYDVAGNRTTEIRPDGGVISYAYDSENRLISTTDPLNQVTQMAYDDAGNMITLTDARGNSYTFTYDQLSRKTSMIYPDGSHEDWTYDAAGNVSTYTTRAGQVRTFTYDIRNREILADWSDSTPDVSKTYDAAGRLLTMSSSVSTLTYTHDNANRLLSETQDMAGFAGGPKTVSYTYNADGQRASLTYPDGTVVSYTYTARDQMQTISVNGAPPLTTYQYDLAGNRTGKTLENNTSAAYVYDNANRLLTIDHKRNGTSFSRFDYTYNSVGNRTSKTQTDDGFPVRAENYQYDPTDQVTGAEYLENSVVNRTVGYQYDPVGNRQQVTENNQPAAYTANNLNQYSTVDGQTLGYDLNGNLTFVINVPPAPNSSYTYDAQNRMIAATHGAHTASFLYDPRNRCVARTINGVTTFFTWDDWSLLEDRASTGALLANYIHGAGIDEILIVTRPSPLDTFYHHHDGLGSTVALTDNTGTVVESYRYDIYGDVSVFDSGGTWLPTSALDNRFAFTGRELLVGLDLFDCRNRMYSKSLGRFLQIDPIRFEADDVNVYRFVMNNVINFVDAYGLVIETKGPFKAKYNALLKCWSENLPQSSQLRQIIADLRGSKDVYTITEMQKSNIYTQLIPTTVSKKGFNSPDGPSITRIDPKSYPTANRTWTWPEALAHELLHAHDYFRGFGLRGVHHKDESWVQDERQVTKDARDSCCQPDCP
jgi:RHS repeat-associated protein